MATINDVQILFRRDTLANWQAANPVLAAGEPAYVTDTKDLLAGDGTSDFNALWSALQTADPKARLASGVA
ncbi:hypothetical protein [Curtobacterium sp. TXMA1]|uniref:hyaluronate lyase N-terminal domain-containing protein n=1 Tax=Curtobacterium sp. TXMA1 TaxID=2876939 RepID=UPI001CCFFC62|nr:hypothetical protein [Curtobacterium sp. TXMA1]UBQ02747.1 hypothetical protein LCG91_00820 [Curtobacterium sp. TXMA1]